MDMVTGLMIVTVSLFCIVSGILNLEWWCAFGIWLRDQSRSLKMATLDRMWVSIGIPKLLRPNLVSFPIAIKRNSGRKSRFFYTSPAFGHTSEFRHKISHEKKLDWRATRRWKKLENIFSCFNIRVEYTNMTVRRAYGHMDTAVCMWRRAAKTKNIIHVQLPRDAYA